MNAAGLVGELRARGLIPADAPAPPQDPEGRPWFIAMLLGLAGWLAGIFVLIFVALLFNIDSAGEIFVVGLILLAAAWLVYFAGRQLVFLEQLALALSIAGQFAAAFYFIERLDAAWAATSAIFGMQLVLFVVMSDRVARTISAFFASIAWVYVVRFALRPGQGEGIFFDSRSTFTLPVFGAWTLPIEWLLTWIPLIALLAWLMRTETRWMARAAAAWTRPAITGLLLGLALGGIGAEPFVTLAFGGDEIGRGFSWWALFPLLSIGLAMVAAFCAFRLRSGGLLGVSIVAALAHLGRFYYLYGTTLTWKALIMLITGAALLTAAMLITKRLAEVRA